MKNVMKKMPGEVLSDVGLITDDQLQQALVGQKGRNKSLGEVLIDLGFLSGIHIAKALVLQFNLPLINFQEGQISREMLTLIPRNLAAKMMILPDKLAGTELSVVMDAPCPRVNQHRRTPPSKPHSWEQVEINAIRPSATGALHIKFICDKQRGKKV